MVFSFSKSQLNYAELYKFYIPILNIYFYLTTYDTDLSYDSNTYTASNLERGNIIQNLNLAIDSVKIELDKEAETITFNSIEYTLSECFDFGWLDNIEVDIYAFDVDTSDAEKMFKGYSKIDPVDNLQTFQFTFTTILDLLEKKIPRLRIQCQCNHNFGDDYCGLDLDTDTDTDTDNLVETGLEVTSIVSLKEIEPDTTLDPTKFNLGFLEFTSGALTGLKFPVAYINNSTYNILLSKSLPFEPTAGDEFKIYQGCNKSGEVCDERFDNYINFSGFEYVPTPTIQARNRG